MDEITAVRSFRSDVPERDDAARNAALHTLQAVLARPLPASRRRFRPTRRVWVLAAAALAAAAVVSSAFGWTSRLLDLVAGQPAPPLIKRTFALENEARGRVLPIFRRDASGVVVEQAHGVIGLDSSAGPVILWAAPTRAGGVCWLLEIRRLDELAGRPTASANCSAHPPRADDPFDYSLSKTLVGDRYLELIMGRVLAEVSTVEVRDANHESETLPVVEGFFLHELGAGSDPITLIARDRAGAEIRRQEIQRIEPVPRPLPLGPERVLIRFQTAGGFPLSFSLAPGGNSELCQITRYRGGEGLTCGPDPRTRVAPDEISVHPGLWNEARDGMPLVTLGGVVGSDVASLDLQYTNGVVVPVPITERFVLFEIPPEHQEDGTFALVGRSAAGEVISRRVLK